MDIARFHRGIDAIIESYNNVGIQSTLDSITTNLANLGANPGSPEFANQFKQALQELKDKLETIQPIEEENSVKETLRSINSRGTLGIDLLKTIQEKISENQISPTLAAKAIQKTKATFETTIANLTSLNTALSALEVEYDYVSEGNGEIALSIPIERDSKVLSDLAMESKEWHQIFSTISEVFDPDRPNVSINSIGTGSWIFYLSATPLVLLGISISLKRVNQILSELIRTKQLIKQLQEVNAPTGDIENHVAKKIGVDLETVAEELVEANYKGTDSSRKNELKIAMHFSLKMLAKKVSAGSKISLQLENKEKPEIKNTEDIQPSEREMLDAYNQFQEIKKQLQMELASTPTTDGAQELLQLIYTDEPPPSDTISA